MNLKRTLDSPCVYSSITPTGAEARRYSLSHSKAHIDLLKISILEWKANLLMHNRDPNRLLPSPKPRRLRKSRYFPFERAPFMGVWESCLRSFNIWSTLGGNKYIKQAFSLNLRHPTQETPTETATDPNRSSF